MIRIAAVGDVHFAPDLAGSLRPHLETLHEQADLFLIAGDLTRHGHVDEALVLAKEVTGLSVPVAAVLGNHDYHLDMDGEIRGVMADAGVTMLEGESMLFDTDGGPVAVAGTKGFGGGFPNASCSDFGEPEMKAFIRHTQVLAASLESALAETSADVKVALLHYSPIEATLQGERLEIYPFLGSYLLAEVVDRCDVDLVIHGHAHGGTEKGVTPGGVNVRNVALPVIGNAYNIYCFSSQGEVGCDI